METETPIDITAVGRVSKLGGLYDARSDKFIHISLFKKPLDNSLITVTSNKETTLKYTLVDSLKEKFKIIDVSGNLKASILFGLCKLEGSGHYFKDTKKSERSAKASLFQSFSTTYEEISITDENIRTLVNMDVLENIEATHVVVGIQWGGSILISVEDTNNEDKDKQEIEGNLEIKMKMIFGYISASGEGNLNISQSEREEMNNFSFEIYGDILPNSVPADLIEAITLIRDAPNLIKEANNGKGKGIRYTLIPINLLKKLWKINPKMNVLLKHIEEVTVQKCVELFDNMNLIDQRLNDLHTDVMQFEPYLDTSEVKKVESLKLNYNLHQTKLRMNLSDHLYQVRSGTETTNKLEEVITQSTSDPFFWENVAIQIDKFDKLRSKISFIKLMTKLNVMPLNKNTIFQQFLWENFNNDIYILFYDYNQANSLNKYMNQFMVMLNNSQDYGPNVLFVSANIEILDKIISNDTKISLYKNGECLMEKYELDSKIHDDSNSQVWSLFDIQNKLLEQIKETRHLKQNPIPINFIYTQLPNQPNPKSLWPTVEWKDVTLEYNGLFFRAEGESSETFGTIQNENAPRIKEINFCVLGHDSCKPIWFDNPAKKEYALNLDTWTPWIKTGSQKTPPETDRFLFLSFYTSSGEVRPRNMAIRIWKRTREAKKYDS